MCRGNKICITIRHNTDEYIDFSEFVRLEYYYLLDYTVHSRQCHLQWTHPMCHRTLPCLQPASTQNQGDTLQILFVRTSSHLAHAETCGSLRRCRSRVLGASGWLSRAPEAAERPSAGSADICVTQILFLEICGRLFYIQEPILIPYI